MLDHLSLSVSDLPRSARFYDALLGPLGYGRVWEASDAVGYGPAGGGDKLALKAWTGDARPPGPRFHLAFTANSAGAVDQAHRSALEAGGRDDGPPGWRPRYGPGYYAAFVVDPDGHRLEAVFHAPDNDNQADGAPPGEAG